MFLPSTSRKWNREPERKTRKTKGEQGLVPGVENVITESSLISYSGCLCLTWLQNWASWLDSGWRLSLSALDCLLLRSNGISFTSSSVLLLTVSHVAQAGVKYSTLNDWYWPWIPDPPLPPTSKVLGWPTCATATAGLHLISSWLSRVPCL